MTDVQRLALIAMLEVFYRSLIGMAKATQRFMDALKGE